MNSILAKLLLINKATETAQPVLAQQVTDTMDKTFDILDQRLIQIVLTTMALTFTCYLFIKLILWTYDFLNTKFLHLNSTGLSYWKMLTMDKTNIYLHLYDYTTGDSINLYCYETVMVFRPYHGVRMFIHGYFSRFKGVSTTSI